MNEQHTIGQYIHHTTCRCCGSSNFVKVIDFGNMPLAGGFLRKDQIDEEKLYPLHVSFCRDCTLVQVPQAIPPEVLFKNYFFFSSAVKTLVDHNAQWASEIYKRFLEDRQNPSVFEIGCNDGVLLKPFAKLGVKAVGIDPAVNVVRSVAQEGFTIINDFFNEEAAKRIRDQYGQFDVIASAYSFGHIDTIISVARGISHLLKDDGVFMFEIYYLGTLIEEMQYDMIYHEHYNYYSLKSLQYFLGRHGMEIFDVQFIPGVRTGATRFYAQKKGGNIKGQSLTNKGLSFNRPVTDAVRQMERDEETKGYNRAETFQAFGEKIASTKIQLMELLDRLKTEGKTIIGYGASGRGTMIMNYCGIDEQLLDYVVDDAPAKHGFYTPGTHVQIFPWEHTAQGKFPDYALLFAWSFMNEVLKKRGDYTAVGGKFIVPLPRVQIVPA